MRKPACGFWGIILLGSGTSALIPMVIIPILFFYVLLPRRDILLFSTLKSIKSVESGGSSNPVNNKFYSHLIVPEPS